MWYGQDGFPYKIKEMEQSHRINVVNFLRRRAVQLYDRKTWREFKAMERAPEDVFNQWMAEREWAISQSPEQWLNEQPLIKALERAIKMHDCIEPDKEALEARSE
jgi:hypothetical protein